MGKVTKSIEVNAPVSECYRIWSDFEQFPRFMHHVESVDRKGAGNVWHWVVKGPMGKRVEWDAEVDSQQSERGVSWHSVRNSEVDNAGAVTFQELDNTRTLVNAVISYEPPAGVVGEMVAAVFSNPDKMVEQDLQNFKHLVENTSTANPSPIGNSTDSLNDSSYDVQQPAVPTSSGLSDDAAYDPRQDSGLAGSPERTNTII
jgi:uncharacterized membrane protein